MAVSIAIVAGLLVALVLIFAGVRRRRQRDLPELNRHPERLDQMLDKTDDA
jgi:hypothetical protein